MTTAAKQARTPVTVERIGAVHCALMRGRHVLAKAQQENDVMLRTLADQCNAHDELVAALRMAAVEIHNPGAARHSGRDIVAIIDAALAKVQS